MNTTSKTLIKAPPYHVQFTAEEVRGGYPYLHITPLFRRCGKRNGDRPVHDIYPYVNQLGRGIGYNSWFSPQVYGVEESVDQGPLQYQWVTAPIVPTAQTSRVTRKRLAIIALRLNQRPRETLGFKTPAA